MKIPNPAHVLSSLGRCLLAPFHRPKRRDTAPPKITDEANPTGMDDASARTTDKIPSTITDQVLDVDIEHGIFASYRILRRDGGPAQVLFVEIRASEIRIDHDWSYGPVVLKRLEKLPFWQSRDWRAALIKQRPDGQLELDHHVPSMPDTDTDLLLPSVARYDFLDLESIQSFNHGQTSRVSVNGKDCVMKTKAWPGDRRCLTREIKAYNFFATLDPSITIMPRLVGYVYEEHPGRVIGIICDYVEGRRAQVDDYESCKSALQRLHEYGVLHGDTNIRNMLITPTGQVRFIDFDNALVADGTIEKEVLQKKMTEELDLLYEMMNDPFYL